MRKAFSGSGPKTEHKTQRKVSIKQRQVVVLLADSREQTFSYVCATWNFAVIWIQKCTVRSFGSQCRVRSKKSKGVMNSCKQWGVWWLFRLSCFYELDTSYIIKLCIAFSKVCFKVNKDLIKGEHNTTWTDHQNGKKWSLTTASTQPGCLSTPSKDPQLPCISRRAISFFPWLHVAWLTRQEEVFLLRAQASPLLHWTEDPWVQQMFFQLAMSNFIIDCWSSRQGIITVLCPKWRQKFVNVSKRESCLQIILILCDSCFLISIPLALETWPYVDPLLFWEHISPEYTSDSKQ